MGRKLRVFLAMLFCTITLGACSGDTTETLNAEDADFLARFAGDWETADESLTLSFKEQEGNILLISQNLTRNEEKNESVVTVDGYDSSNNRWLLYTLADETFYYSVIEADEDMITVNSFVSRPDTEGASKPFDYYRKDLVLGSE